MAKKFRIKVADWQLSGRSLLNRDARGNYKFAHRSIMEYLFAQQLAKNEIDIFDIPVKTWTEQIKSFLIERINRKSWRIPIYFVKFFGGNYKLGGKGIDVFVKPFEIAIYPVTNLEYEEFNPAHKSDRNEISNQDDQPVNNVSREDAVKYCKWLNEKTGETYRLPTEVEWEFAASGGGIREYPWGNEKPTPNRTNYDESKIGKTTPVGIYNLGKTTEGIFEMAGNIWEWCTDWYDKNKNRCVIRGGAYNDNRYNLRCVHRFGNLPNLRNINIGFRLIRNV